MIRKKFESELQHMARCAVGLGLVLLFCGLSGGWLAAQQTKEPTEKKQPKVSEQPEDLDAKLLEQLQGDLPAGLDDELFRGLTPGDVGKPGDIGTADPLEKSLLDPLNQGEDLGEEADPLLKLARRMRLVTERIEQRDTGKQVRQAQQEIVDALDQLIQQAQQSSPSSSPSSDSKPPQTADRNKPNQQQPSQGNPGQQPNNEPARQSTDREEKGEVEEIDLARLQDLVKLVWGHLPPHLQQQMQNSAGEKFLPKYQLQIEQYFKDLIQERNKP